MGARQPRRGCCPRRPLDTTAGRLAARERRREDAALERGVRNAADAEGLATFVTELAVDARSPRPPPGPGASGRTGAASRSSDGSGAARLQRLDEAERAASRAGRTRPRPAPPPRRRSVRPCTVSEFRSTFLAELEVAPHVRAASGRSHHRRARRCRRPRRRLRRRRRRGRRVAPTATDRPIPLVSDADRAAAGLTTTDVTAARVHRQFLSHAVDRERGRHHVPARRSASHRHPCADPLARGRRAVRSTPRGRLARRRPARRRCSPPPSSEHRLRGLWIARQWRRKTSPSHSEAIDDIVLRRAIAAARGTTIRRAHGVRRRSDGCRRCRASTARLADPARDVGRMSAHVLRALPAPGVRGRGARRRDQHHRARPGQRASTWRSTGSTRRSSPASSPARPSGWTDRARRGADGDVRRESAPTPNGPDEPGDPPTGPTSASGCGPTWPSWFRRDQRVGA